MNQKHVNYYTPYEWLPYGSYMFTVYNTFAMFQMFEEGTEHRNTMLKIWLN